MMCSARTVSTHARRVVLMVAWGVLTASTAEPQSSPPLFRAPTFDVSADFVSFGDDNPLSIVVGDFNGDGRQDMAVPNAFQTSVAILLSEGNGDMSQAATLHLSEYPLSTATGDFNGDSKPDLATVGGSYPTMRVEVLLGQGNGTFVNLAPVTVSSSGYAHRLAVGYFDGDDKQDLVIANSGPAKINVLLGHGDGSFSNFG